MANAEALGKGFLKNKKIAECWLALDKIIVNCRHHNGQKYFAECRSNHSANFFYILQSVRISIRQSRFVMWTFAERTLPSIVLGKVFAECKGLFTECKNTRQSHGVVIGGIKFDLADESSKFLNFTAYWIFSETHIISIGTGAIDLICRLTLTCFLGQSKINLFLVLK